ncbi:MAG: hypothetical protein Ct9H300mP19_16170 [Dehalococcoidia bacterium]|nr:MAG: hypothetical protein Ct9H300mP19_16170 [Dehalococcoidia bacterium]
MPGCAPTLVRAYDDSVTHLTLPFIKVYRHPVKSYMWEFPAGLIEDGETPENRETELIEETGIASIRTKCWVHKLHIWICRGTFHSVLGNPRN